MRKAIILGIVFFFLISSSYALNDIYSLEETVEIELPLNTVEVIITDSDGQIYKSPPNNDLFLRYKPRKEGMYEIEIITTEDTTSYEFIVENRGVNTVLTNKREYLLGESIYINNDLGGEIEIDCEGEVYKLLGGTNGPATFKPSKEGVCRIELSVENKNYFDEVTVKEENMVVEPVTEQRYSFAEDLENELYTEEEYERLLKLRKKPVLDNNKIKKDYLSTVSVRETNFESQIVEVKTEIEGVDKVIYHNVIKKNDLVSEIKEARKDNIKLKEVVNVFTVESKNTGKGILYGNNKGTALWRCSDWDTETESCNKEWQRIQKALPSNSYSIPLSEGIVAYAETNLSIITVQSYPIVGDYWEVEFLTYGKENLSIRAVNGTTWSNVQNTEDLKFSSLTCDGNTVLYEWNNGTLFVEDHECNGTNSELSKVFTVGKHSLEFVFGEDIAYAFNFAVLDSEDWETYADADVTLLNSNWSNVVGDDCDWQADSGGTPSTDTGPTAPNNIDHTLGTTAGKYLYMETSSGWCQTPNPGSTAIIESDSLNATQYNITIDFWYHMYGSTIGTLYLEANNGSGWNEIWSEAGAQGNSWLNQESNVGDYTGQLQFRFRGVQAGQYYSDFALDDINITGVERSDPPTPPTALDCDANNNCNITVEGSVELNASGAIDPEGDGITYLIYRSSSLTKVITDNTPGNAYYIGLENSTLFYDGGEDWTINTNCPGDEPWWACSATGSFIQSINDAYNDPVAGSYFISMWDIDSADEANSYLKINNNTNSCEKVYINFYTNTGLSNDGAVESCYVQASTDDSSYTKVFDSYTENGDTSWYDNSWHFKSVDVSSYKAATTYLWFGGRPTYTRPNDEWCDWDEVYLLCEAEAVAIDQNSSGQIHSILGNDFKIIQSITITINVDSYNPEASVQQSNTKPDLNLEIYNGSEYIDFGVMNLTDLYTSDSLDNTDRSFNLTTTRTDIINSWLNPSSRNVRIKSVYTDFYNATTLDEINYSSVSTTTNGTSWSYLGNHTEGNNLTWDLSDAPNENCVDFRVAATDPEGSNISEGYYYKQACLNISNNPPNVTNVNLNESVINQSHFVRLNMTITDELSTITQAIAGIRHPNGTVMNYSLNNIGSEYYYIITDTNISGNYNLTEIRVNDSAGINKTYTYSLYFTVTTSPPSNFNLLSPNNDSENSSLTPTLVWEQSSDENFDNYTIIIDKDPTFSSIDFTYNTSPETNISVTISSLDDESVYYWRVIAYDVFGSSTNSNQDFVYKADSAAPEVILDGPENDSNLTNSNIQFQYTPSETFTLTACSLYGNFTGVWLENQTNSSVINGSVNNFSLNLNDGRYVWNIECRDLANNVQMANNNRTFLLDSKGPSISLESPANSHYENNSNNITFFSNATDTYSSIDHCNFTINGGIVNTSTVSEGITFNHTEFLFNGNYTWNVTCIDDLGNVNTSETRALEVSVVDEVPPMYSSPITSHVSPTNFTPGATYFFNITWSDNIELEAIFFESNFSGTLVNTSMFSITNDYSYNITTLGAGIYSYRWFANDTSGNINSTIPQLFSVDKAQVSINLTLNGTQGNISINEDNNIDLNATIIETSGYLELLIDGSIINNGISPLGNTTSFTEPGLFNITSKYYGTENYSAKITSYFLTVNDTTNPSVSMIVPSDGGTIGSPSFNLQYVVSDSSPVTNCSVELDGVFNDSDTNITRDETESFYFELVNGNYDLQVFCTDEAGNTGSGALTNFDVDIRDILNVAVTTSEASYERNEYAEIYSNVTDAFFNPLNASVSSDIIINGTFYGWWNNNWERRKPIYINNSLGHDISGVVVQTNISGLNNRIDDCDEIRIVNGDTNSIEAFELVSGDDSTRCEVRFNADLSANTVDQLKYYVYYNNSGAGAYSGGYTSSSLLVQRDNVVTSAAGSSDTIDTAVEPNSTFVLISAISSDTSPDGNQFTVDMTSSTSLSFARTTGAAATISWQTITDPNIYVQRGTETLNSAEYTTYVDINQIDTSESFIIVYGRSDSTGPADNNQGFFRGSFVNSTRIALERETNGSNAVVSWQVVQWSGARVYSGDNSFSGTSYTTSSFSAVDLSRSIVIFGKSISGDNGLDANHIRADFNTNTDVIFNRVQSQGTAYVAWFAIELPAGTDVQSNSPSIGADTTEIVSSVVENRSFHVHDRTSTGGGTTFTNGLVRAELTSATGLLLDKQTGSQTNVVDWFLAEMPEYTAKDTGLGEQEIFVDTYNTSSGISGIAFWNWSTANQSYGNYAAVSTATKAGFQTARNGKIFEIIQDITPPKILNPEFNVTVINQSKPARLTVTITDISGINITNLTILYPNSTYVAYDLIHSFNDTYYFDIPNTNLSGTYYLNNITAMDEYGNINLSTFTGVSFTVTTSPPSAFNLSLPVNATESQNLLPNLTWEQSSDENFDNYTIIIDKDPTFSSIDFTYNTYSLTENSYLADFALDANSLYYWRVIAYDIFGSSTQSSHDFIYITDLLAPSVALNSPADYDNRSSLVDFNFTPSDTNTIASCVLYGNFTGSWAANESTYSVDKDSENNITIFLSDNIYEWNVFCVDIAGNSDFALSNRTLTVDTTGPVVNLETPEDNTLETSTNNVQFSVNTTDLLSGVSSCSLIINDVITQTENPVTEGVSFSYTELVLNGQHNWSVNCSDSQGNIGSSDIYNLTVLVVDEDPPLITQNYPENSTYVPYTTLTLNYTPGDATGIENCSLYIDGTLNQTNTSINNLAPNYFTITGLVEQSYNWSVSCYDNSTGYNLGSSYTYYFTPDLMDPTVILHHPEDNNETTSNNVQFNHTPSDTNLDVCLLYGNFTGSWDVLSSDINPSNAVLNTFEEIINDGIYEWNVWCNDSSGRSVYASNNRSVKVDSTNPYYSNITLSHNSPQNFSPTRTYYFNITWEDNFAIDTVFLENDFNGTLLNYTVSGGSLYSYGINTLKPGVYNYRWYANDSIGLRNNTPQHSYTVNKSQAEISLELNGTRGNITIDEGFKVPVNASLVNPSSGYIELYEVDDEILLSSGSSPLGNLTIHTEPGLHQYLAHYPENENYTYDNETWYLTIIDTIAPNVTINSPENDTSFASGTVSFQYLVEDTGSIQNCSLYVDGSLNQTDYIVSKDVSQSFTESFVDGNYTFRVSCYDTVGHLTNSETRNFEISIIPTVVIDISVEDNTVESGEYADFTMNSTDVGGLPLISDVLVQIIRGNTSVKWWDSDWEYRSYVPLLIDKTDNPGARHTTTVEANFTNLSSHLSSCLDEVRIVRHINDEAVELPFQVLGGDNNTYCEVKFDAELYEGTTSNEYYAYYGNPGASSSSTTITKRTISVQHDSATGSGSSIIDDLDSSVDADNSFLIFTSISGDTSPDGGMFTGVLTDTQARFDRYAAATGTVVYSVVTSPDISVQRGSVVLGSGNGSTNININSVNLSESFIIVSSRTDDSDAGDHHDGWATASFVDSDTISISRGGTTSEATVHYQVVEWDNANVQSGNAQITGAGVFTATGNYNSVNTSRAFPIVSRRTTDTATGINDQHLRVDIQSSTEVLFDRNDDDGTMDIEWFIVELPDSIVYENQTTVAVDTGVTTSIPSVQTNETFVITTWENTGNGQTFTNAYFTTNLTDSTTLTFQKQTASQTATVNTYAIDLIQQPKANQTGSGEETQFIYSGENSTDGLGIASYSWSTFNKTLGNYTAVSIAYKTDYNNGTDFVGFEIIPDTTPPNVTLVLPPNATQQGAGYFNFTYVPFDHNINNCTLYIDIDGIWGANETNQTPKNNTNNTIGPIYLGAGFYNWNIMCTDTFNNSGFAELNYTLNITFPDLTVTSINFSGNYVEGNNITVTANITNIGDSPVLESFTVGYYLGDPYLGGVNFGNETIQNLSVGESIIINSSFFAVAGDNNVFVYPNFDFAINESDYSNNKINASFSTGAYHFIYGDTNEKKIVSSTEVEKRLIEFNISNSTGNVLVSDADSVLDFGSLLALGRNTLASPTGNDFSDLDSNLNLTNFSDSTNNLWTLGTNNPILTDNFNVSFQTIENVPVINSTNNSNFYTGILWDGSDDVSTNLQYDQTDKEDIVFISKINAEKQGAYGIYDYEIRVPAYLRDYKGGESEVYLYIEIE